MFENYFMEFELDMMKNDHMYESAYEELVIKATEISMLEKQGFMEESCDELFEEAGEKFSQKIKDFFKNIYEAIKKLVEKVKFSFEVKMKEKEVNKKLKELKKIMAANAAKLNDEKVTYFNTAGYMKAYTKYIDTCVSECKKLYNKEYNSVEEYEDAVNKANKKLDILADNLKLNNDDAWKLRANAGEAFKYTEKEAKNFNSTTKMYEDKWKESIEEMEKLAEKEDDASKINDIKSMTSKMSSKSSKGFNKITSSTISNIVSIIVGLGFIGLGAHKVVDGVKSSGGYEVDNSHGYNEIVPIPKKKINDSVKNGLSAAAFGGTIVLTNAKNIKRKIEKNK